MNTSGSNAPSSSLEVPTELAILLESIEKTFKNTLTLLNRLEGLLQQSEVKDAVAPIGGVEVELCPMAREIRNARVSVSTINALVVDATSRLQV